MEKNSKGMDPDSLALSSAKKSAANKGYGIETQKHIVGFALFIVFI